MKRVCPKCNQKHEIAYVNHRNNTHHLVMIHGKQHIYLPYEADLNIPTILTRKDRVAAGIGGSVTHQSEMLFGNTEHDHATEGKSLN